VPRYKRFIRLQVEAIAKARDWTAGMAAYDLVLAKMKSVGAASLPSKVSAKASKKKRKQPEPDTAPASATAQQLATDPVTEQPVSKKDKKRKKAKASAATSTETSTESSLQGTVLPTVMVQVTTVQEPAPAQQPRNRHVGRYHKTAAAKKAGSYSKSDLAAILGVDSFPTAAPVSVTAVAQSSEEQVCTRLLTMEHCILSAVLCTRIEFATSMLHSSTHIPSYVNRDCVCTVCLPKHTVSHAISALPFTLCQEVRLVILTIKPFVGLSIRSFASCRSRVRTPHLNHRPLLLAPQVKALLHKAGQAGKAPT